MLFLSVRLSHRTGTSLGKQGVPPPLHLDRVYTLVKPVDKLSNGYQLMNKSRIEKVLQHIPKVACTLEAKAQAARTRAAASV